MSAQNQIIVRSLTAGYFPDDIGTDNRPGDLGRQVERHRHRFAALEHVLQKNGIGRRQRGSRNLSDLIDVAVTAAGMSVPVAVCTNRADDDRLGSAPGCLHMAAPPRTRSLPVAGHA